MPTHKYDLGVIGNCSYLAYIDTKADVKWMCMPRFDSSFLFGSLLDEEKGGHFYIRPVTDQYENSQYYIQNTNLLTTEFATTDGRFKVIDCAPRMTIHERQFKPQMLVRKIQLISGNPVIRIRCEPRGDYGRTVPEIVVGSNHIRYLNLGSQVRLTTDVPLNYIMQEQSFVLDQDRYVILTYGEPLEAPLQETAEDFIHKTIRYWHTWVKSCYIPNIYQDQIIRSAL
ncbi:MAG TPA: trehalase-like domain-containing protein, partial [Chitinophagaceae bacterium]